MVSDTQKLKIIQEFSIPENLKDDLAYCQRSLRDCVKVHQYFAKKCKGASTTQQGQLKAYLLELEAEMQAIAKDQNELVQELAAHLKRFQQKTASEKRIVLGDDLAEGYVAWVLSNHCELHCALVSYVPHTVSERLTESQLYQKYRLEPILKNQRDSIHPGKVASRDTRLRKRPVLQTSLLKPKEERELLFTPQAKRNPSPTPPSTPPTPPPFQSLPGAMRTATSVVATKRKGAPEQLSVPAKKLRPRSATSVAVKQEPKLKEEPIDHETAFDSEDRPAMIAIRESAAVKRGRNNLLQALKKVKSVHKTFANKLQTSPPSSTAKSGRNKRAGSVNTSEHCSPSISSSDSSNSRSSTPGNSGVGTRKPTENCTFDESSNERLAPLEESPAIFQPTNIHELEQYGFLKLFGLFTIEDSDLLKGRKNERKRRSCCSTERKDFHYGRFDFFEQQFYNVQKRRHNANKRLLYTATSVEKSIKKCKPWSNGVFPPPSTVPKQDAADIKPSVQPDSSVSVKVETILLQEPENKVCFVCKKLESSDALTACIDCCNMYHLSCHVNEHEIKKEADEKPESSNSGDDCVSSSDVNGNRSTLRTSPQRGTLCPSCWDLAKISKK